MTTQTIKINYKEYPQCMFSILSSCLQSHEGDDLRRVAGSVYFRSTDSNGNTYRNGLLHSYDDQPAVFKGTQKWYRNGEIHREGDKPAVICGNKQVWYWNGERHREGDLPAVINGDLKEWYRNGELHREGDLPAVINGDIQEWWYNGEIPAIVSENNEW